MCVVQVINQTLSNFKYFHSKNIVHVGGGGGEKQLYYNCIFFLRDKKGESVPTLLMKIVVSYVTNFLHTARIRMLVALCTVIEM